MASYTANSADHKCPLCSKALEAQEREQAEAQLEKSISKRYGDQSRKKRQDFEARISQLKAGQQERIRALAKKHQAEKKLLQARMAEQAKKAKQGFDKELLGLKRNYQMQLEQIREIYHGQNLAMRDELRNSYNAQLQELKKNYDGVSASSQAQLEMMQKWLQDQLVGDLHRKMIQMEQAKSTAELHVHKLVSQLDERNSEVGVLQERIRQLEQKVPAHELHAMNNDGDGHEAMPVNVRQDVLLAEPENEQQKELLSLIKEIAQERQEMGVDEMMLEEEGGGEESAGDDADQEGAKQRFWGSKIAKRFNSIF